MEAPVIVNSDKREKLVYNRDVAGRVDVNSTTVNAAAKKNRWNKYSRRSLNIGMVASIGLTTVSAFIGLRRLHLIGGLVLVGFGALHGYRHKKHLL